MSSKQEDVPSILERIFAGVIHPGTFVLLSAYCEMMSDLLP
jgi:hypothetical protein